MYARAQVSKVRPFMPLAATAVVVLIVGSMIACNVDIMANFGPQVGVHAWVSGGTCVGPMIACNVDNFWLMDHGLWAVGWNSGP